MPDPTSAKTITDTLQHRFGEQLPVDNNLTGLDALARIASRKVHRRYLDKPVDAALLRLLCACALSAPSKSDLQQADIVILEKPEQNVIADLIPDQPFIRTAPAFLVFLASGRRLPEISKNARQAVSRTIISTSSSTPRSMPASCWRRSSRPPTPSDSAPARSA